MIGVGPVYNPGPNTAPQPGIIGVFSPRPICENNYGAFPSLQLIPLPNAVCLPLVFHGWSGVGNWLKPP
eukprot:4091748-Karenia_brevis.AAC.1